MMKDLSKTELHEGIAVDIPFPEPGPTFGDIYLLVGEPHPNFPSSDRYPFDRLNDLQFSQVDNYFGVRTQSGIGDDVAVWLHPVVAGEVVDHHPGPFDALRSEYSVLRNPIERSDHFIHCVEEIAKFSQLASPDLDSIGQRIKAIQTYWKQQNIEVGSEEALQIDH